MLHCLGRNLGVILTGWAKALRRVWQATVQQARGIKAGFWQVG